MRYELRDARGSIESLEQHQRLVGSHKRRARVTYGALTAERQLGMGHSDAACDTWRHGPDEYP
ncbi:hypothetical protein [Streptomyces boetiae]|uniref:hypothetical protein n=1 Tax=Streptomyces boetiae TaxID=3075541 RepID=UPI00288BF2D9|nr:hypothetical protein [Streptomyces sp. DSM 44917]